MPYVLLALSIALAACSNVIVKSRSLSLAGQDPGYAYVVRMVLDPWTWVGAAAFGTATIAWLLAIRRLELSAAQPAMALVFVIVPLASHFLLNESLPPSRVAGLIFIASGVFLAARTV